jgi:hypothetical protein
MSLIMAYTLITQIESYGVANYAEMMGFENAMIYFTVWALFSIADALWVRTVIGR